MTGWLRLHRGWRDSDVFADDPCSEREAWLWLIESAAWKPCHRRGGKGDLITVERGQLHTAERTLAKLWKWDRKRVVRFLGRLERCEMIHLQKDHSGILLTISNYAKYQDKEADDGAIHGADEGPSEDHRGTTQEEGKEGKEDNNPPVVPQASNDREPSLKPEHVVEAWNDMAERCGLPKVDRLTKERRRKLASRIRDHTVDDFTEAIAAVGRSSWLRGENNRSWRANFDFFIRPDSITKLKEGTYG